MELTKEQRAILDGEKGAEMAKIMKTLVMYGETFGATKMVPVTSTYGHIVTSFGVIVIKGVFKLMDELVASGIKSHQLFSADPRPTDKNVPKKIPNKPKNFAKIIEKIRFKNPSNKGLYLSCQNNPYDSLNIKTVFLKPSI